MSTSPDTVAKVFLDRVAKSGPSRAFQFPVNENWKWMTWNQTGERVKELAGGLLALGLGREQRVSILSNTRIDWIHADLAINSAGGATTTIYPSNTADECDFILQDSETVIVFAEDESQVKKLLEKKDGNPRILKVITFDKCESHDGFVIHQDELAEMGKKYFAESPDAYEKVIADGKPSDLATLIYTSGTTGQPKGVELTNDCWVFEGEAMKKLDILSENDLQYLWLPLSHSFGKVLMMGQLCIGYPTAVDGRIPKLVDNLGVVKPTVMGAPPRIFEKVYNKVVTGAQQGGGLKYKIFKWAVKIGGRVSKLRQAGKEPSGLLAIRYKVANKLVFSKLKARFGGNIRFFISGSAPLSREMAEFFHAADILICEGYGLTESSAASFVNVPKSFKFGTVGKPLPGVEVKIDDESGEILLRGRGIMRGYHNRPDADAETLKDGWLRTGDKGELDDGFLKITDRIKDLIKTSGGKYVAPQHVEGTLKSMSPYLSQVVVHGNNRNFCSALITIDPEAVVQWQEENELTSVPYAKLSEHDAMLKEVQGAVDRLNASLPSYSTIKRFAILPNDLSVEEGELTASMKVKRKFVEKKYKEVLDGFYEGATASL